MTLRPPIKILFTLLLCGCAGQTFTSDAAPEFLIVPATTPLYRSGPQQAGPPEERLSKGDRVRMLRREFGYSLVLAADGMTGYVANQDLKPVPPLPTSRGTPLDLELPPAQREEHVGPDAPPVEAPLPKPDLDVVPTDAPVVNP